ncbi:MAG: PAS domain S-box protein [Blastocatellia bacterium]
MKPNTALGLLLAGLALWLLADEQSLQWQQQIAWGCAGVVLLIGFLTLGEYFFTVNFGIDQLLFREAPGATLTPYPGRMGPNTALCCILTGTALFLLEAKRRAMVRLAQGSALLSLFIALAALIGYTYGVTYLLRISSATQMAPHTAAVFALLAIGLLTARPRRSLVALLVSQNAGGVLLRQVWPQAILLLILLGWLRLEGEARGLYETSFGTGALVLASVLLLSLLLWRAARQLTWLDAERREAEAAEQVLDTRLRVTLRSIGDAVISTNARGEISFMNTVAEKLTGWSQADATGRPLVDVFRIINEHTRAPVESPVEKVIRENVVVGLANHTVLLARDGREIPIDDSGAPIRDEHGQTIGAVLVFRDITERKRAETAMARLAAIVESSDDAIISKNLQSCITSWNRAAEKLFGYTAAEVIGKSIMIIIPPERAAEETRVLETIRRGEKIDHYETLRRHKDGHLLEIALTVSPLRDRAGEITGASKIARDITGIKRAERAVRESEERFSKAFRVSPMVLAISSLTDGRLIEVNETFERTTGFMRAEALGKTTLELGLWKRSADRAAEMDMVRQTGQVNNLEYTFCTRTGEELIGLLSAERIEIGGEPFALTVIQDITERKNAEAERERLFAREQQLRRIAEEANRLKDEFLATVSHELRTPLNHMLGWTVLLRAGKLPPDKVAEAVETIERNVRAQNRLVEDLLDVSRIITGKLQLQLQPIRPAQVIEAAVASARPTAEAKGIWLEVRLDARSEAISGDADRLQQVVWNLLSNAIKFTPSGGRVVVALESDASHLEIKVSDTGEGIAPDFLPYVFDRFSQADGSTKRRHGGLGLGLAIVRHLVELHGGEIKVESPGLKQGATFIVRLPLLAGSRSASSALQDETSSETKLPLDGVRVLVVDDEADSRWLITSLLIAHGVEVAAAGNMSEALQTLATWRPDVLVADIGMPEGDGYELIRTIRQRDAATEQWLPAVAVTAYSRPEDRLRALRAGYQIHVAKPVEPHELLMVVASLSGRLPVG